MKKTNEDYFIAIRKDINNLVIYPTPINAISLNTELKIVEEENIGIYSFTNQDYTLNDDLEIVIQRKKVLKL